MANCNRCGKTILMEGTCSDCSTKKLDNYETLEQEIQQLKDKLHRRNMLANDLRVQIEDLKAETERLKSHKESALSWIDYRDSDSQDEIDLMNKHKWHNEGGVIN